MADNNSVSLDTLQEQQKQLAEAVSNLTATRSQLEDQLSAVRNNLATNAGALQYANALIQSITGEEQPSVDDVATSSDESSVEDEEVAL
jgi:ABC-type transporter Mla subunit MlaD